MRHDKLEGLIHFTHGELDKLDEPRTPVDHRCVSFILAKARLRTAAIIDELNTNYVTDDETQRLPQSAESAMREELEKRQKLETQLQDIKDYVDLEYFELLPE